MICTIAKKKRGRGKWHIVHPWAECEACLDLGAPWNQTRREVIYDSTNLHELVFAGNYQIYVDMEDICGSCLTNLRMREKKYGEAS